jgi:hypothetical protein
MGSTKWLQLNDISLWHLKHFSCLVNRKMLKDVFNCRPLLWTRLMMGPKHKAILTDYLAEFF